jgi:threonine/homoserine/homoserine lactone efflux protein
VLCIRRTLADGMGTGLVAGLGAATADAAYGAIAGFGLSSLSGFLVRQQTGLELCGGAFLCYLGARTFFAAPAPAAAVSPSGAAAPADAPSGWPSVYGSTLFLTLSNPSTLLSFVAVFAGLGLGAAPDRLAAATLVAGVFLGSALWWLILSAGIGLMRSGVTAARMLVINRLSGAVLAAFGLYALARGLLGWIGRFQP